MAPGNVCLCIKPYYSSSSCCLQHLLLACSFILSDYLRDVDFFIEHLEKTIQFFTGLQNQSEEADGDFVPFI